MKPAITDKLESLQNSLFPIHPLETTFSAFEFHQNRWLIHFADCVSSWISRVAFTRVSKFRSLRAWFKLAYRVRFREIIAKTRLNGRKTTSRVTERLPPFSFFFFSPFHRCSPYLSVGPGSCVPLRFILSPSIQSFFFFFTERTGSTLLQLSAILLSSPSLRPIRSGRASFCSLSVVSARTSPPRREREREREELEAKSSRERPQKEEVAALSSFFCETATTLARLATASLSKHSAILTSLSGRNGHTVHPSDDKSTERSETEYRRSNVHGNGLALARILLVVCFFRFCFFRCVFYRFGNSAEEHELYPNLSYNIFGSCA